MQIGMTIIQMYAQTRITTLAMTAVVEAMTLLMMVLTAMLMVFVMQEIQIEMGIPSTITLKLNVVVMKTMLIVPQQIAMETESVTY